MAGQQGEEYDGIVCSHRIAASLISSANCGAVVVPGSLMNKEAS